MDSDVRDRTGGHDPEPDPMETHSIYLTGNGSTSNLGLSQISSVGFNNLKKLPTNLLASSTISNSTVRTNALSRLFTKNRSNSTLTQPPPVETVFTLGNNSQDTFDDTASILTAKSLSPSMFRLGKKKLRFPSKSKPDLSIQTAKPPDDTLAKTPTNKKSLSSPMATTFHSIFHRTYAPESLPLVPDDHTRTLTLSSNSSNSHISDVALARIFRFTDPDYAVDDSDTVDRRAAETPKYTDGLGIITDDDEYIDKFDAGKAALRFFTRLLVLVRPLFLPSQQKRLPDGTTHPCMTLALEEVSHFIRDNFDRRVEPKLPDKKARKKPAASNPYLEAGWEMDEYMARQILLDLLAFFHRCLIIMKQDLGPGRRLSSHDDKPIERLWDSVAAAWTYFNTKVRFPMLTMFFSLQKHLQQASLNSAIEVNIDTILVVAFRDVVITPALGRRQRLYEESRAHQTPLQNLAPAVPQTAPPMTHSSLVAISPVDLRQRTPVTQRHHLGTREVDRLKAREAAHLQRDNGSLLRTLVHGFGVVAAHAVRGGPSDSEHDLVMFDEGLRFLMSLHRPEEVI